MRATPAGPPHASLVERLHGSRAADRGREDLAHPQASPALHGKVRPIAARPGFEQHRVSLQAAALALASSEPRLGPARRLVLAAGSRRARRDPTLDLVVAHGGVDRPLTVQGSILEDVLQRTVAGVTSARPDTLGRDLLALAVVNGAPAGEDARSLRHAAFPGLLAHRPPGLDVDVSPPLEARDLHRLGGLAERDIEDHAESDHDERETSEQATTASHPRRLLGWLRARIAPRSLAARQSSQSTVVWRQRRASAGGAA